MRVYELAKQLGMENQNLILELKRLGITVASHSSALDEATVQKALSKLAPSRVVYDWWVMEVLKEWPAEVFAIQTSPVKIERTAKAYGEGIDAVQNFARQIEKGAAVPAPSIGEAQREAVPERSEGSGDAPATVTSETLVAVMRGIAISSQYPLTLSVGSFMGTMAPVGDFVFIRPDGIKGLAGEYLYALGLTPVGGELLVHPWLVRFNYLKRLSRYGSVSTHMNVLSAGNWSPEEISWKDYEQVSDWFNNITLMGPSSGIATRLSEKEQPPDFLPADLREQWRGLWQQEWQAERECKAEQEQIERDFHNALERAGLRRGDLAEDEAKLTATLHKVEKNIEDAKREISLLLKRVDHGFEVPQSLDTDNPNDVLAFCKKRIRKEHRSNVVMSIMVGIGIPTIGLATLLAIIGSIADFILGYQNISFGSRLERWLGGAGGLVGMVMGIAFAIEAFSISRSERQSLLREVELWENKVCAYSEREKKAASAKAELMSRLREDDPSERDAKREKIEKERTALQRCQSIKAECARARYNLLAAFLRGRFEREREEAFSHEEPWFNRSFRDANLPRFATLADRVFRMTFQRLFDQHPTLRLLDYGS